MTALASAAFRLALRGLAVFPLAVGAKVPPAGSHGLLDGTTDPDVTRARWEKSPHANIGAATGCRSGIWVLDVDVVDAVDGDDVDVALPHGDKSLASLEAEYGPLPLTVEASTPRGGRHLYWRWDTEGSEIRNSAGRVGPGLDVRGEGGMIVLPPSVLSDGRGYRWIKSGVHTFADAPPWLVTLALPPPPPPRPKPKSLNGDVDRYCAAAITAELKCLAAAGEHQRNDQLNRSAFAVARFVAAGAVPEEWARGELEGTAVQIGLPVREVRLTINSAFAAGLQNPRELPR